jgi:hypothetical protein
MVAVSVESEQNKFFFVNKHQESLPCTPCINDSDWTEFLDIVYNDDSNVEVERINKFESPLSAFQFSPFRAVDERRDDEGRHIFPAQPEDCTSTLDTSIQSEIRDSFQDFESSLNITQKKSPENQIAKIDKGGKSNPVDMRLTTTSRMKKKKGLNTGSREKLVPSHVVCDAIITKSKQSIASNTYSPMKDMYQPPSSNQKKGKHIKDSCKTVPYDDITFISDQSNSISTCSQSTKSAEGVTTINMGSSVKTNEHLQFHQSRLSNLTTSTIPSEAVLTKTDIAVARTSILGFVAPKGMATRALVTASVYHNQTTGLWITTINTNQHQNVINTSEASKYLKAFSLHSEREARESAYAYAPPKMWPLDSKSVCFSCDSNFSMFKRPSHCRNCGACICSSCYITWNKAMIPETYNNSDENSVKICKACDVLSRSFRQALLEGNYEDVITIYNTGNVNLRCPFMNVKGAEVM